MRTTLLVFLFTFLLAGRLGAAVGPAVDEAVKTAIDRGQTPGAVVLVLHEGKVIHRKAYGLRAKQPAKVAMTADTVFDMASLTKSIATASSIMLLVERGKLKLTEPVAHYWPAFGKNGKKDITLDQLLLHTSGLIADNPLADYKGGIAKAFENIAALKPTNKPGERFVYSDVNYIVLGHLVELVSGMPLDAFARKNLFEPLGMKETGFRPSPELCKRAAPTTKRDGKWIVGEVHDPRAHLLGGVAGHAGLFSTADDLAIFTRMLLAGGKHNGKQILSAQTVRLLTGAKAVPRGKRTRGWDVDTAYSGPRGTLFPKGVSYGHTGFTGTSIWIDPKSQTVVIILANRVHPDGKGDVRALRRAVATAVAKAVGL
jgi:CubicO group peptidase (beta-lactamase class C family)